MAERLSRHALSGPRMVFCPFCVGQFYQQQELQDHLIQAHSQELHLLRDQEFQHFQPETCPCCNAQFLQPGLGPRHLVHHHPDYVVSILLGSLPPPSGRPPPAPPGIVPSTPPPDRHAFCLLCGQRFLRKHVKLLALHLQQQHPAQFSAAVQHHCSMAAVPPDPVTPEGRYLTPSLPLSQEMSLSPPHHYEEVDTTTDQDQYLTILSPVAQTTHTPQDTKRLRMERGEVTECKGIFRKVNTLNTPHKTQQYRSFRRAGPRVIGETYQGIAQPEPPPNPITGLGSESCLLETETEDVETLKLREKENYHHYTSAHLLFRCNLCGDRFDANPDLLSHLKQEHMAVSRVLKPQYSCAKCPANFFKNAFLLKHSLIHTQSQPSV